jgi:hypothetical protein
MLAAVPSCAVFRSPVISPIRTSGRSFSAPSEAARIRIRESYFSPFAFTTGKARGDESVGDKPQVVVSFRPVSRNMQFAAVAAPGNPLHALTQIETDSAAESKKSLLMPL